MSITIPVALYPNNAYLTIFAAIFTNYAQTVSAIPNLQYTDRVHTQAESIPCIVLCMPAMPFPLHPIINYTGKINPKYTLNTSAWACLDFYHGNYPGVLLI
jgi:hypothetical protein